MPDWRACRLILATVVALMPFAGQLGMTIDEASPERVVARLAWTPEL